MREKVIRHESVDAPAQYASAKDPYVSGILLHINECPFLKQS